MEAEKKKKINLKAAVAKTKNFMQNTGAGKLIGSALLGIGSVIPFTAPFMPSIKAATTGLSGAGKHDFIAYISGAAMIVGMILVAMGKIPLETVLTLLSTFE